MVGKILKKGELSRECASVGNVGVRGMGKILNWQGLAVRREGRDLSIVIVILVIVIRRVTMLPHQLIVG
jgi:hypothetical protein